MSLTGAAIAPLLTTNTVNDGIVRLIHVAVPHGQFPHMFMFSTDALWLSMPSSRNVDSIGSIATGVTMLWHQDFRPVAGYRYTMRVVTTTPLGGTTITEHPFNVPVEPQHRINGNWQGMAAPTELPPNSIINEPTLFRQTTIQEYNSFISFFSVITQDLQPTWFNSIGSHYHNGFGLTFGSPSVSISVGLSGNISASIGFSPTFQSATRRHVPLTVRFIPWWMQ